MEVFWHLALLCGPGSELPLLASLQDCYQMRERCRGRLAVEAPNNPSTGMGQHWGSFCPPSPCHAPERLGEDDVGNSFSIGFSIEPPTQPLSWFPSLQSFLYHILLVLCFHYSSQMYIPLQCFPSIFFICSLLHPFVFILTELHSG